MAEATSREDCHARHRGYSIDISRRLNDLQRSRLEAIVAPIRPGDRVLDVGCNSGYIVQFLPRGCTAFGVDVSAELVAVAQQRLVEAHVAPAESLPYPDKSMDVVILGEILEHVFDPVEALREAARVARRVVVGSTPHEAGKWGPKGPRAPDRHRFHVRCFTEPELRAALHAASLRTLRIATVRRAGVDEMYVFHAEV